MRIIKILLLLVVITSSAQAQKKELKEATSEKEVIQAPKKEFKNKGKFYAYWGWNRAAYSASDIRFQGKDYDFTLSNVVAKDRQTPFSFNKYLNPLNISIPQTNEGIGYFFSEHYSVFAGVDHMKYVTVQNQYVGITGHIGENGPGKAFAGEYNHDSRQETDKFLTFEHTDGLNYVHVSINRFDDISNSFGIHSKNFVINLTEGIGTGMMFPKTNTKLFGQRRHDHFHISGYGVSAQMGLNFLFYKYFFIQTDLRGGYINMPSIRTTFHSRDKASQHFTYMQAALMFGARFKLF